MDGLIRYGGAFWGETVVRASGSYVETASGRRVLDFTAGQICATIGHNHPRVADAVRRALDEVIHLNSWMLSPPVLELAGALLATVPPPLAKAMFLSTGGESIEVAVRMAKLHTGGFEVASLTRSWHGLTGGAAAITLAGGRRGYGPTLPGSFALPAPYGYRCPIRHCDGNCDCSCLEAGFDLFDQASVGAPAAVVAEPVLSAGGVIVPPAGYFARLLELCEEREMLLVLDECQTGLGRLGTMYGFEAFGVVPDFLVLSKTLGGGIPIGAVVTSAAIEATQRHAALKRVLAHRGVPIRPDVRAPLRDLDAEGQYRHLHAVATACRPTPFYVYELAGAAGYAFDPPMLLRLRDALDNVVGMKVSDAPWEAFAAYLLDGYDILVGPEALIHRGLEHGAVGAVSALAAAFPDRVAAVVDDPTEQGAAGLRDLRAAIDATQRHAALKRVLARRGVPIRPDVRGPLRGLSADEQARVDALSS